LAEFRQIPGYEVRWSLVYAKDYGVPQNRPRVLLVGIRTDVLEACSFLDKGADAEDAVVCGFLPPPNRGSFPDLIDLLGDLIDPKVATILRSGDFPSGSFETSAYPRKPMNELQAGFRTPPVWAAARAGRQPQPHKQPPHDTHRETEDEAPHDRLQVGDDAPDGHFQIFILGMSR
jgi:DNA (cytosine-5)-methyltransferase 1